MAVAGDIADRAEEDVGAVPQLCQIQASSAVAAWRRTWLTPNGNCFLRPMWPAGSALADSTGLVLEVSFDEGVPTWKVQRHKEGNVLPDFVASGMADSFAAAKAAALHVAEAEL